MRQLPGFRRGSHHEPEAHHPAAEAFVRRIGEEAVKDEAEALFRDLRQAFGWKRRQLSLQQEGSNARIEGPGFHVSVELEQHPDRPRCWQRRIEVGPFTDASILQTEALTAVFQRRCESLLIRLPRPLDIASQIDAMEDSERLGPLLEFPADGSWVEIRAPGPEGIRMHLESDTIAFHLPPGGDLRQLLEGAGSLLAEWSAPRPDRLG